MHNLCELRRSFTANLMSTGRQWRRAVDQVLNAHGISEATAAPLLWIGRLGGGVRQVDLANKVGIESPSLVRLLDQLESLGLVVRKDDPTDRRAKGVWLTGEGEAMAAQMESLLDALRAQILSKVNHADLEAAARVLKAFDEISTLENMSSELAEELK